MNQPIDEGLAAIRLAFEDAVYPDDDARECAELMMLGAHRHLEMPDAAIMEIYGVLVTGNNVALKRTNDSGKGYRAELQDFSDLLSLINGTFMATPVQEH